VATDQFKRGGAEQIREMLGRVTAANVSDAQHRRGWLPGIMPLDPNLKCVGPAFTVWTYPGDWNKPVQAIDQAQPGDVLVVDVRGQGPAVWGEEATKSCLRRGIAGIVIHGAARDSREIRELGFPLFSTLICPAAGDPKGMGMMGVPLKIGEVTIHPGDWVIADADGVVIIPREKAVETANRSLAVVEREAREKAEIMEGSTLGQLAELEKWEQKR
jgi:3-hexulose-6-phosphate synthase/6-phospho-3-hexuloisomerase